MTRRFGPHPFTRPNKRIRAQWRHPVWHDSVGTDPIIKGKRASKEGSQFDSPEEKHRVGEGERGATHNASFGPSWKMAGKGSATPATYSPSPTIRKGKPPTDKDGDLDWVRPDGRGFQQCRPACKLKSYNIYALPRSYLLPGMLLFASVSYI